MTSLSTVVTVACEGDSDGRVARRLLQLVGLTVGKIYVCDGKGRLDKNLPGYNNAAKLSPWLVLRDLDRDADCAPTLIAEKLPEPAGHMNFRVAVRAAEAWLMADRERFATYFGVSSTRVTREPESLLDPKMELMNLARKSRIRDIRESVPVQRGMSGRVGPGYTEKIVAFATDHWRPEVAAAAAPSLAACMRQLRVLAGRT